MIERGIQRFPMAYYAGGISLLTALATFGFWHQAQAFDLHEWRVFVFTALFLVGASQLAVTLLNWLATLLAAPRLLPRLDFDSGIPSDCRRVLMEY